MKRFSLDASAKRSARQPHNVALPARGVNVSIGDQNVSIDNHSVSIEDQNVSIDDQTVSIDDQKFEFMTEKQGITSPLFFILSFLSFLFFPGCLLGPERCFQKRI